MCKKIFLRVVLCALTFFMPLKTQAAYVGNPARIYNQDKNQKKFTFFSEGMVDIVYDRGAKFQSDEAKVDSYWGIAGATYDNWFTLYGGLGAATAELSFTTLSNDIKWDSDTGFSWLAGTCFKLYDKKLENFHNAWMVVDLDFQYRNTDIEPDRISIGSIEYQVPDPAIGYSSIEYNDWHAALTCALDFDMFSPYAGLKYSDFESCVRVMRGRTVFQKDNAEADDNFGAFIGLSVKPFKFCYASVEAGFIDEKSISSAMSFKF